MVTAESKLALAFLCWLFLSGAVFAEETRDNSVEPSVTVERRADDLRADASETPDDAPAKQHPLQKLPRKERARAILLLVMISLLGLLGILAIMFVARWTRRVIASNAKPLASTWKTAPTPDDWASKPLVPDFDTDGDPPVAK